MSHIIYRGNNDSGIESAVSEILATTETKVKNYPLNKNEIDGNFKSLSNDFDKIDRTFSEFYASIDPSPDGTFNPNSNYALKDHTHEYALSDEPNGPALSAYKVRTTVSNGGHEDVLFTQMSNNDYFRLRVSGTDNTSEVELATADNGIEPVCVRQYEGAFTTVKRTAFLLDASGNTSFPGKVTSASGQVTGALTVNETLTANAFNASSGTVSGNLSVTGTINAGAVNQTSDIRLKNVEKEVESDGLSSLKGFVYTFKNREDDGARIGLVAQDVQKAYPEAVREIDSDGHLGVDYNAIVAVLVNKVNEQDKIIKQLTEKIDSLVKNISQN